MITDTITTKISDLIKIFIPQEKISSYTTQLNTVLAAVEVLQELDTKQVPITAQTHGLTNILREDIAQDGLNMADYPNRENFNRGYFVVDRVL